jgi:hypothetical protein
LRKGGQQKDPKSKKPISTEKEQKTCPVLTIEVVYDRKPYFVIALSSLAWRIIFCPEGELYF